MHCFYSNCREIRPSHVILTNIRNILNGSQQRGMETSLCTNTSQWTRVIVTNKFRKLARLSGKWYYKRYIRPNRKTLRVCIIVYMFTTRSDDTICRKTVVLIELFTVSWARVRTFYSRAIIEVYSAWHRDSITTMCVCLSCLFYPIETKWWNIM